MTRVLPLETSMPSWPTVRVSTFAVGRTPRQRRLETSAKAIALAFIAAGCLLLMLAVVMG